MSMTPPNPWIEHDGGACPVPPETIVAIRLQRAEGVWDRPDGDDAGWFDSLDWWTGSASGCRIIAYRLLPADGGERGRQ